MDPDQSLADGFEAERGRLTAIATRVVGSRADAEDVVQEAWLRLVRQEPGTVENVAAWLTTVVGRLCLDALRSRAVRAEAGFEPDLGKIVVTEDDEAIGSPEKAAVDADNLGTALVIVLNALEPDERMAFVLHDLFGVPFHDIGEILGKSSAAAKMSASRARRKVRDHSSDVGAGHGRGEQRRVVDAFMAASRDGDFDALLDILHPDLSWEIRTPRGVATRSGSDLMAALARGDRSRITARRVLVNGDPGVMAWDKDGQPVSLMACTVQEGRITRLVSIADREWLGGILVRPPVDPAAT